MAKNKDNAGAPAPQGGEQLDNDAGEIETASPDGTSAPVVGTRTEAPSALVSALILRDCGFGGVGTVVKLEQDVAETGRDQGALDLSPAAIQAFGG